MKAALTFILFFFQFTFFTFTYAQNLTEHFYGSPVSDDIGIAAERSPDNALIFLGQTANFGNGLYDFYLIKTTLDGDTLWTQTYGGTANEFSSTLIVYDNFYYLCGTTESFGAGHRNLYVIKTDLAGQVLWEQTYDLGGAALLRDASGSADGGVLLTGSFLENFTFGDDLFLLKIAEDGSLVWEEYLRSEETEGGEMIRETRDGGYLLVTEEGKGADKVRKLDADRNVEWIWDGQGPDSLEFFRIDDIQILADSSWLFLSNNFSYQTVLKVDPDRNLIWARDFVTNQFGFLRMLEHPNGELSMLVKQEEDDGRDSIPIIIQLDASGNVADEIGVGLKITTQDLVILDNHQFVLLGETKDEDEDRDIRMLRFEESSNSYQLIWDKTFGASVVGHHESAHEVIPTQDGGFMIVGGKYFEGWKNEIYLIKTDRNGAVEWDGHYGTTDIDIGLSIAQATDRGYVMLGYSRDKDRTQHRLLAYKINAMGIEEWNKEWMVSLSVLGGHIIRAQDGGYLIVAPNAILPTQRGAQLIKLNANGSEEWTRVIYPGNSGPDYAIATTKDGDYLLGGTINNQTAFIHKIDAGGNTLWEREYPSLGTSHIADFTSLDNGNIVASGLTLFPDSGFFDSFILTLNANGDSLHYADYAPPGSDNYHISSTTFPDGGHMLFLTHYFHRDNLQRFKGTRGTARLVRLNEAGEVLWEKDVRDGAPSIFYRGQRCGENEIVVVGIAEVNSSWDIYLLKADAGGTVSLETTLRPYDLQLSPNPGQTALDIRFEHPITGPLQLEVFDLKGRLVFTRSFDKGQALFNASVALDFLPAQMYMVRLQLDGQSFVRKWVKE